MRIPEKKSAALSICFFALVVISSLIFDFYIVGTFSYQDGGLRTNPLSVTFGWQWLYLLLTSLVVITLSILKNSKKLLKTGLIVLLSLLIVFIPAQFIEGTRLYITGEGGPSGPKFACILWERQTSTGFLSPNEDGLGICSLMSIPSFNKFLIDRRYQADSSDSSFSYYVMLTLNEAVVIGGLYLARRELADKTKARVG